MKKFDFNGLRRRPKCVQATNGHAWRSGAHVMSRCGRKTVPTQGEEGHENGKTNSTAQAAATATGAS